MQLILSLICLFIISYFIITVYLKCKMPFWSKQPVFHIYNIWNWLRPPGLISNSMPPINKYVDLLNIKTFSLTELIEERTSLLNSACNFIKDNYIKDTYNKSIFNKVKYSPTKQNIIEYLSASNHAGYVTIYQQPKLLFNKNTPETYIDEIIAIITARPLYVLFPKKKITFTSYYIDNLCVHPAYRKKNVAANMIQTHHFNISHQNKLINTCIFKREGELNAIVPLVVFNTNCISISAFIKMYEMSNMHLEPDMHLEPNIHFDLPPSIKLIEIGISQTQFLVDFIKAQMYKFKCVILPDVTNITNLIKTNNLKIYALIEQNELIACYVFRIVELYYDGEQATECIAMISNCTQPIFNVGFRMALKKFDKISLVLIEDTAHAHLILKQILLMPNIIKFVSSTAFFFYNYACYSFKNKDILIIY